MSSRPSSRTVAVTLSALLLPVAALVGSLTSTYYKVTNPSNIDITNSLAYLQQTMIASIIAGSLIGIAIVWLIVRMYQRDKNFTQAKLPLVLLVSVVLCIGAIALLGVYRSAVEDQYRTDNGQPTLQEFFDRLEQNKANQQ